MCIPHWSVHWCEHDMLGFDDPTRAAEIYTSHCNVQIIDRTIKKPLHTATTMLSAAYSRQLAVYLSKTSVNLIIFHRVFLSTTKHECFCCFDDRLLRLSSFAK